MLDVIGIIVAFLVMGVLIFVHELGHFLLAKLNGIGVEAFSIGFGKELFGFTLGETRYRISLLPFGGYCKLKGEGEEEAKNDPKAMYNRPPYARLLTVLAGPAFNYLFALIVLAIIFFAGFKETIILPYVEVIEKIDGKETPAFSAGLKNLDYIIAIDDKNVENYADIPKFINLSKDKRIKITFVRENKTNELFAELSFDKNRGLSYIGVSPVYLPVIGEILSNSPAEKGGLKKGDKILLIDNHKISYYHDISAVIKEKAGQEVSIVYERKGSIFTNKILIDRFEGKGFLGIYPSETLIQERIIKAKNFLSSFEMAQKSINAMIVETVQSIAAMFKGKINAQKNLSGPLRIIGFTSEIAMNTDFVTLLRFMALISVALAFFNLLPIPGLDGSHVILNFIETVTPIRIPIKVRLTIEYVGLLFIIFLSVFIFFNDIINIFGGR
ncbi:MAG: RIP metalloprotease RseP [Brevinematales bacterium]|nr:RIP metalloprotease RseP [Brevinematales bacterium]